MLEREMKVAFLVWMTQMTLDSSMCSADLDPRLTVVKEYAQVNLVSEVSVNFLMNFLLSFDSLY